MYKTSQTYGLNFYLRFRVLPSGPKLQMEANKLFFFYPHKSYLRNHSKLILRLSYAKNKFISDLFQIAEHRAPFLFWSRDLAAVVSFEYEMLGGRKADHVISLRALVSVRN